MRPPMTRSNAEQLQDLLRRAEAESVEIHERNGDFSVLAFLPGTIEGQVFDKDDDLALCQSKLSYLVSLLEMKEPE